jgi:Protein of unknown function (DUF1800)
VTSSLVSIAWRRSHDHGRKVHYQVLRNGRHLAHVHAPRFDDHGVSPGSAYRYAVRTIDGDRESGRSRILFITTPAAVTSATLVPAPPAPPPAPRPALSAAMVDRLFWRAGFGPNDAERSQWTGQPIADLVEFFVSASNTLAPAVTPPSYYGNPIDPLDSDDELQMEWLDVMQRSTNPLVERLTFFWHRHFAVSKDAGID